MRYVIHVTLWDSSEFTVTCTYLEAAILELEATYGDALWMYSVRSASPW